jgi:hypothetical protein
LALSDEAKSIFDAFKKEKGLGQDDAANRLILTRCKSITIDRLIDYCKAYDEIEGRWPEPAWEGEAVLDFILECEELPAP